MARHFGSAEDPDDKPGRPPRGPDVGSDADSLTVRVEIWDQAETVLHQVVALTSNRTIGWAAYYCAQEQYPNLTVILRDNFGVLSRRSVKQH